ncbi:MAG TPA: AbrB/MazE/SpoVT family DNA-binding domain-containing protein [Pyrinomonadaceae bacterium]|nr:AbrB/MazE/SpoVT family DNA-binding domain-containing protein [Pyrinomonadaceae bacterium]
MEVQVQKWGNSLALRIPKAFAVETQVTEGSSVEITTEDGNIVLKPITKKRYTLDELVGGITKENLHDATDWGKPVGNEVW